MQPLKFSVGEFLLLKAALNNNKNIVLNAWKKWKKKFTIETATDSELRILPTVYKNILNLSPSTSLPIKINGQMKHIYTKNYLHLIVVLKLAKLFQNNKIDIIFGKGINICQRFNLFSTRRMNDIDFYINENDILKVCRILKKNLWFPIEGMTWDCLIERALLRKKSINITKEYKGIQIQIDLHWRLYTTKNWRLYTTKKHLQLYKEKMKTAEMKKIKNQTIYLDNVEFATLNTIEHGIFTGNDGSIDQCQMILDLEKLLPVINQIKFLNLLKKSFYFKNNKRASLFFTELKNVYKKIGCDIKIPKIKSNLSSNILNSIKNVLKKNNFLKIFLISINAILFSENEKNHLNYPKIYYLWRILFELSFFEKLIIKLYGPISKTKNYKKIQLESYYLYNYSIMNLVGGPGWAYQFKNQNGSGFWADRTDCRLLFFLKEIEDYKISILLSKFQETPLYFNIKVYANGFYLGKISDNSGFKDFIIKKRILISKWVEISLRTNLINNNLTIPLQQILLKKLN